MQSEDSKGEERVDVRADEAVGGSAEGVEEEEQKKASARKERVLHTRVPAVLEQELKRLAESLRMPVSNVVRAILEDAVTAVDLVGRKAEGGMTRVVDRMVEKRERLRDMATGPKSSIVGEEGASVGGESAALGDPFEGVLGFQPLLLAAQATCSVCGARLVLGSEAYVGVRDAPGPRVLVGPECLPKP
jgi:hypothetical protein